MVLGALIWILCLAAGVGFARKLLDKTIGAIFDNYQQTHQMNRITREEYAIRLARTAAMRSEDPHLQVGAVVLDAEGRILGTGYNGLSPGMIAPQGFWEDRDAKSKYMIHAEVNACALISRGSAASIAVTHSPCARCAAVIAAHGIKRVYYAEEYDRDPSALEVLAFHRIEVIHVPIADKEHAFRTGLTEAHAEIKRWTAFAARLKSWVPEILLAEYCALTGDTPPGKSSAVLGNGGPPTAPVPQFVLDRLKIPTETPRSKIPDHLRYHPIGYDDQVRCHPIMYDDQVIELDDTFIHAVEGIGSGATSKWFDYVVQVFMREVSRPKFTAPSCKVHVRFMRLITVE